MNRKSFLKKAALASLILNGDIFTRVFAFQHGISGKINGIGGLAEVSEAVNNLFMDLLRWMKENGWTGYLKIELDIDLELDGDDLKMELVRALDKNKLSALKKKDRSGFDDFAGSKLIEPGNPAMSLIYHALASPRVKPDTISQYPSMARLDALENYIYALKKWDEIKTWFHINNSNLVLAVFAYEYRPAFKTPHHAHADIVYSRTGISRVGEKPLHYDSVNRCYTNKPKETDDKTGEAIAVTPARYGLFLAKVAANADIEIMSTHVYKKGDRFNDADDSINKFLQPVRKVFDHDLLFDNSPIVFSEKHVNEKLSDLLGKPGLIRRSSDLIESDAQITNIGSTFLVISGNRPLIRFLDDKNVFTVPKNKYRFFTSYTTNESLEDLDIEILDKKKRIPNSYKFPRNGPMYVHVGHEFINGIPQPIPRTADTSFEDKINAGGYDAPVYEDSICDGCVTVNHNNIHSTNLQWVINKGVLPAFSIVTAPDFFPDADVFDLSNYDVEPGTAKDSNFYEGGVASLASSRIGPNPNFTDPITKRSVFAGTDQQLNKTITAVTSLSMQPEFSGNNIFKESWKKDYAGSGFLPDVCSSVFAPGWDVTYADKFSDHLYLSTQGLGSPFVEDMKLCAAMNGMWAAASPDTARVFQGTIVDEDIKKDWYANPTAIPLLDDELGLHPESPGCLSGYRSSLGWDGEQGAFLIKYENDNKVYVNFTDLGRADYVQNALDNKFNMSILRRLSAAELISRMEALKKCINKIETKRSFVGNTKLWLVSAEKLGTGSTNFEGKGIPLNLMGNDKEWATKLMFDVDPVESCYLFVFINTLRDVSMAKRVWAPGQENNEIKRRLQVCIELYVCQVSGSGIMFRKVLHDGNLLTDNNWQR